MRKILVALGVGVGLGLSCPAASSIQNFSAASNDRFANQAAFIGSGLDWSGVGRSSDGRWATMLTATVFLSANHYHPGIGSSLSFYPGNDPGAAAATRMVTGGQRIGTSDLWVGFLNMALPTAIAGYDFSRVAVTEANFVSSALCDQSVFMGGVTPTATGYGAVTATVQTVGENRLEGFIEDATDTSLSAVGDVLVTAQNQALDALYGYTLSGFEAQLNGGDSGSPLMLVVDGRLMLAGDAAHQTPPFLGQGMCAAIRDVSNLAWKLEAVLRGCADDALLDTYESERSPHVKAFIDLAVKLGDIIQTTDPQAARERDAKFKAGQPEIFQFPTPRLGPGVWQGELAPVAQVFPQPTLANGHLLDTLLGLNFAVLGEDTVLAKVSEETRERWQAQGVVTVPARDPEVKAWLDQQGVRAVLLRPDRYILGVAQNSADLDRISALLPAAGALAHGC
jgi:hypothetical protein